MFQRKSLLLLIEPKNIGEYGTGGVAAVITPPTLTLTVIDDTKIKLSWAETDVDHLNYPIEISTDGVAFSAYDTASYSTVQFTATGLTPETEYWFRIKSVGPQTSLWSNEPSATTSATVAVGPDAVNTYTKKLSIMVGAFK